MISRVVGDGRMEGLASLLKSLRGRAGLTQEELADRSGLSIRAISDLERGRTVAPQRRSVELLAEALGVEGASLEHFRRAARARSIAHCPGCDATLDLGDLVWHAQSA